MNLGSGQKLAIDSHGLLTYLRTLFVDCVVKSVNDLCELVGNGTCVEIDMIKVESQNAHSSQLEEIL